MEETFTYDNMNRLTGITLTRPSGSDLHCTVTYTGSNKEALHYVLKDNLGSWTTITAGGAFEKPMFDRGYTGHEHLTDFGLVNMNGRVYDPMMSSFLSADRFVQNPLSAMGFNRYSYCLNNPLRFVDPTGWLSGPGDGYGEHPLGVAYEVDGQLWCDLPEVTILADNPSLSNRLEKMRYNTYYYGGERLSLSWASNSEGPSIGPNGGGCGGGGGTHGGGRSNQKVLGETPPVGAIIHTGNGLFLKAYWHYQFGKKEDFWVDASTLKLDYITQKDLSYHDGIATVNLFDHSKTAQSALTLGKIKLTPVGENLFEIHYDTYNFEIEWEYGWTTRNIGTAISGFIHGPVLDDVPLPTHWMDGKPCYAQPSVYWGGPFKIHFTNCVYIKP